MKKLRRFAFATTVITTAMGLGTVLFGVLFSRNRAVQALDLSVTVLAESILLGALLLLFSSAGIVGVCRFQKFPLRCYIAILYLSLVLSLLLLMFYAILYLLAKSELTAYCDSEAISPFLGDFAPTRQYDNLIRNLGLAGFFCGVPCDCNFATTPFTWNAYTATTGLASTHSFALTDSSSGITHVQACDSVWSQFDSNTQEFINLLGEVEKSNNCAGVCIASNVSVASNTEATEVNTKYQAGEGSCFSALVDRTRSQWTTGLAYFSILSSVLILTIIPNCLLARRMKKKARRFF